MKIDLTNETPKVKQAILEELIPAYQEKVISEMTSLSASTIGYYRRTHKIPTFHAKKKAYQQEANKQIEMTLEHNKEYAYERARELCADYGISDSDV